MKKMKPIKILFVLLIPMFCIGQVVINGLIENRIFNIIWVDESNGIGLENGKTNVSVKYNGNSMAVQRK